MRITKTDLKEMIIEVLNEANDGVRSGQELRTTGVEQSRELHAKREAGCYRLSTNN